MRLVGPTNLWETAREAVQDCALSIAILAFVVALMCAGCAAGMHSTTSPVYSHQDEAVELAWRAYGRTDSPPTIRWVKWPDLTCMDPESGKPGFPIVELGTPDGDHPYRCRGGFTMAFDWLLAAYNGEGSITETAVIHELQHVALAREGVFLGHHGREDFYRRIDEATRAVRAAGY